MFLLQNQFSAGTKPSFCSVLKTFLSEVFTAIFSAGDEASRRHTSQRKPAPEGFRLTAALGFSLRRGGSASFYRSGTEF